MDMLERFVSAVERIADALEKDTAVVEVRSDTATNQQAPAAKIEVEAGVTKKALKGRATNKKTEAPADEPVPAEADVPGTTRTWDYSQDVLPVLQRVRAHFGGNDELIKLLDKFKVKKATELKLEQYAKIVEEAEKLIKE